MQGIIVVLLFSLVASAPARPLYPSDFLLWNYFPFLQQQQQQIQMMQQVLQPVNIPYSGFDLYLNGGLPIPGNMPIIGEIQFDVPVQSVQPQRPIPTTTSTTTSTTTTKTPMTTTTTTTTTPPPPPTKRRASVKQSTPPVAETLKSEVSKGIFEMARNIQANILAKDPQTAAKFNVFSPINVAAVLSLLELGAKGQTHQELQHILNFDKTSSIERSLDRHYAMGQMLESLLQPQTNAEGEGAQIDMANGIFMQTGYSMNPDYRSAVEAIYQSQLTALDFQRRPAVATQFINDWVSEQTNGKIGNILANGIDSRSTRMMVASAVYFKALWMSSFIPQATSKRAFYPNGKDGQKIMVETMGNGGRFNYHSSQEHDCSIIALPFKGDSTTMYVVLPNQSTPEKLKQLQKSLTSDAIEDMISKMKTHNGIITLPKMHLTDTLEMSDVLDDLRVQSVFDGARSDLSGITEHSHMTLDGFVHKIDLTIHETGTEAAAATVSSLTREEFEFEFRVDSPFMFVVRHDATKLPIFYGSVMEPVNV